jgi:hypothetical protein
VRKGALEALASSQALCPSSSFGQVHSAFGATSQDELHGGKSGLGSWPQQMASQEKLRAHEANATKLGYGIGSTDDFCVEERVTKRNQIDDEPREREVDHLEHVIALVGSIREARQGPARSSGASADEVARCTQILGRKCVLRAQRICARPPITA